MVVDPEVNILLPFADAVRLYVKHRDLRAVALGRKGGGMGRTVLSLKELRHHLSGSRSGTSFLSAGESGLHASISRKTLEKRMVLDMVGHLCELVLEWIQVVNL